MIADDILTTHSAGWLSRVSCCWSILSVRVRAVVDSRSRRMTKEGNGNVEVLGGLGAVFF
jgi:hypothetical protein